MADDSDREYLKERAIQRGTDFVRSVMADFENAERKRAEVAQMRALAEQPPVPMLLWCPQCNMRHVDRGEFATKVHHTHACQQCGCVWRPAIGPTVGVQFLPGFQDASVASPTEPGLTYREVVNRLEMRSREFVEEICATLNLDALALLIDALECYRQAPTSAHLDESRAIDVTDMIARFRGMHSDGFVNGNEP